MSGQEWIPGALSSNANVLWTLAAATLYPLDLTPTGVALREMSQAIFLAVARDAKLEIRIRQLGCAAVRAAMQRLVFGARFSFKRFGAASRLSLPIAALRGSSPVRRR